MRVSCVAVGIVVGLLLAGCGEDLGECDQLILGGPTVVGNTGPYAGQALMGASCSSGRCHSALASGEMRVGAPADLDFDVTSPDPTQLARARSTVQEHIDSIWGEINEGAMPPAAPAGSGALSAANKETIRNWLACGAPVAAPAPTSDDWSTVFSTLAPSCNGCHGSAGAAGAGDGFLFGDDACTAYNSIVNRVALTPSGMCVGSATLVIPGNAASSLFLQKLKGTQACGSPMPLTSPMPLAVTDPATVTLLENWIAAGAPAPLGCTPAGP